MHTIKEYAKAAGVALAVWILAVAVFAV